jgi:hypothetical protein
LIARLLPSAWKIKDIPELLIWRELGGTLEPIELVELVDGIDTDVKDDVAAANDLADLGLCQIQKIPYDMFDAVPAYFEHYDLQSF